MRDIVEAFEVRAGGPLPGADALRKNVERRQFRRGGCVFHAGARSTRVYFVRSGVVKLTFISADGVERVREFVADGQIFACLETLEGPGQAEYSAIACEDCDIDSLEYAVIEALAQKAPLWARCAALFVLDTANNRGKRERDLLTLAPPDRFHDAIQERPWLLHRIAQRDLAAYIGVTPVSLSRFKAEQRAKAEPLVRKP